ncbi:unnamed protein product [Vicia faba]|uniref:Thiolase N-terminal domain-containing protein n=1 Tax=Vicia faba TaxID=3906 RepID=A0AAV0YS33_VICFA|nr:unnamed protein product [Vicia faba]
MPCLRQEFIMLQPCARLRKLRPNFKETGGSVTAGNTSSISDGAATLVLVSVEKALKLGLQVIAKITGYADAAQEPESLLFPELSPKQGRRFHKLINEAFIVAALHIIETISVLANSTY